MLIHRSGLVFDYTPQLGTRLADAFLNHARCSAPAVNTGRRKPTQVAIKKAPMIQPSATDRQNSAPYIAATAARGPKHHDQRTRILQLRLDLEPIWSAVGAGRNMHRNCAGKAKNSLEPRADQRKSVRTRNPQKAQRSHRCHRTILGQATWFCPEIMDKGRLNSFW